MTEHKMLCGSLCDHGSACKLPVAHDPEDRHETEHGCIFYDPHNEQETRSMTEHEVPLQYKCKHTVRVDDGVNLKCQLVDGHPGPCLWLMPAEPEASVSRDEFTALTKQVEGLARDVATLTNALRDYEVRREARMREHREALFAFEADQRRREREFLARIAAAAERLAGTDSFSLGVPRIKL